MDDNERLERVLIFFLDPGKKSFRLPRIENKPDNKPIVSGIIVTCRSTLAISGSLVASRRPWRAAKQRTVAYQSGRGHREQRSVMVTFPVPRRWRPGHCRPFQAPILPATLTSGVRRGGGDSPARRCT